MTIDVARYERWHAMAARIARSGRGGPSRRGEGVGLSADDLLHEAIMVWLRRDGANETEAMSDESLDRWMAGVMRNVARNLSRGQRRRDHWEDRARQARPSDVVGGEPRIDCDDEEIERWWLCVDGLPRGLRQVVVLACAGLNRQEIAAILGLNDAAMRKRLSQLRLKHSAVLDELKNDRLIRPTQSDGPARRGLREVMRRLSRCVERRASQPNDPGSEPPRAVGFVDPDGHAAILSTGPRANAMRRSPGQSR